MPGHRKWVPGPRPEGCGHWLFPQADRDDPRMSAFSPKVREKILAFDQNDRPVFGFNDSGFPICGHLKRDGTPCRKVELDDNGRCEIHSKSVESLRNENVLRAHGYIPRLADKIEEALSDTELVSARNAIATYEAMIREVGEDMGEDRPAEMWGAASEAWSEMRRALGELEELPAEVERAMGLMESAFAARDAYHERESKIRRLMMEQLAHKKEERELMKAKEQFLTARDLGAFKQTMAFVIRKAIEDEVDDADLRRRILGAIQSGLALAFGVRSGALPRSGGE